MSERGEEALTSLRVPLVDPTRSRTDRGPRLRMANVLALPFKSTRSVSQCVIFMNEAQTNALQVPTLAASLVSCICLADPTTHPNAVQPDADGLARQRETLFGDGERELDATEAGVLGLTA